jgi:hypothetical protein
MSGAQKSEMRMAAAKARGIFQQSRKYSLVIFLAFVACLYAFLFMRVNSLSNIEPSQATVDQQVQAARVPHLNESIVRQLESLQDNNVSVQTLFNETRNNPFQE